MKQVGYGIGKESWDAQRDAGRYNPASIITVEGQTYTIGAGSNDALSVYLDEQSVYVLAVNRRMGYAGLEVFDRADGQPIGDQFCQSEEELKELVGPKGLDYTDRTLAVRLAQYALQ